MRIPEKEKQLSFFHINESENEKIAKRTYYFSIDVIILGAIFFVLMLIFSFILGVEKGKSYVYRKINYEKSKLSLNQAKNITQPQNKNHLISVSGENNTDKVDKNSFPESQSQNKETPKNNLNGNENDEEEYKNFSYIIQVASYLKEKYAKNEVNRLTRQGYKAFFLKKGKYIAVYVGKFKNKTKALHNMQILRKYYKDCILRKL